MATKTTKSWGLSVPTHPWLYEIPAEFDGKMKNTRDPAPGLLMSAVLPAPSLGLIERGKSWETHMMDLNQLYTVLFCLRFLALGAIEYLVLRWVWRRWFSLGTLNQKGAPQWARLWFSLR